MGTSQKHLRLLGTAARECILLGMSKTPSKYARTADELKTHAINFWPTELLALQKEASVIPLLIGSQDKFISVLDVAEAAPGSWKTILSQTKDFPANLFLKHLEVLADVGGEPLKRLRTEIPKIFKDGKMRFVWNGKTHCYAFQEIHKKRKLDNKSLFVDGKALLIGKELDGGMEDVIMLLLFGAAIINAPIPEVIGEKCMIGSLIGNSAELREFVKQRYIFVSRITGGATANTLGQLAQDYVRDLLKKQLPKWSVTRNGQIPNVSQNDGNTDMDFDVVAKSPMGKCFAIEVSFQVTTNSTIERKSGQAQERARLIHKAGHKIAYVIDGAGNFERASALRTICQFSDCTVAFTPPEIAVLAAFLKSNS
jgi:hypothetical protein